MRILIVEDEVSFSDPLSYVLRKEGYDVAVAETGPDGLAEFDKNGADLVLLDMNFTQDLTSGREGLLWLDRILKIDGTMSVVMITAYGDAENRRIAKELGADDFLIKPIDFAILKEKLKLNNG